MALVAYSVYFSPVDFVTMSVKAVFAKVSQIASVKRVSSDSRSSSAADEEKGTGEAVSELMKTHEPVENIWTNNPVAGPVIHESGLRLSRVAVNKQSRVITGEVKAVSREHGLLIVLSPDIGGEGVIAPDTLIADFYRRFEVGEKIAVAVKGVVMQGAHKQFELLLAEP